ncbi:hypothetical protein E3D46_39875 [Burkholderia cepacia]|uniref:Uncharacterized protein n=1 Tax=Burkholderia cepacia TaxID=292 RepID=A0AAX2RCW7_BURCE|nr:hypothetical protein E3D37_38570 [Burkholderia cepacia]TEU64099.1 hypothetical protein E3D42_36910 [Burkholderia cepacia]TEU97457.1 hypothetical protein E3D44_40000 [Burkholderia cepacia]TEV19164.1 hypothetical protein E3D45_38030 [Burkholderia cepacia]TEV47788.1 hypothetical protein E3D46_39875 [Burkholderia cepacia]
MRSTTGSCGTRTRRRPTTATPIRHAISIRARWLRADGRRPSLPRFAFPFPVFHRFAHALHAAFASGAASAVRIVCRPERAPRHRFQSFAFRPRWGHNTHPIRPFAPRFLPLPHRPPPDFFRLGGLTRTSSSAVISGLLDRTVPSRSDLRRTPAQQGSAAFVTGSATRRGTR